MVALKPGKRLDSIVPTLRTDYLVSLDSGLVLESEDWLDHLLLYADLPDVAAVAPLILDRKGRVEQAGLILGTDGEWEPAMRGWNPAEDGYAGSLSCARDVSAISGAGALISRTKLNELGGFCGAFATVDLTWVELSVRAAAVGLSNVVTPQSVLRRLGVPPAAAPVLDRQLLTGGLDPVVREGRPVPQSELRRCRRRLPDAASSSVNVLFVSHCDFTGNSALPRARDRERAGSARGISPAIAVPGAPGDGRGRRPAAVSRPLLRRREEGDGVPVPGRPRA